MKSHPRRTAEEVCIEYALAVAAVRIQTHIMADNRCEVVEGDRDCYEAALESRPSNLGLLVTPSNDTCIDKHWQIETYYRGDDYEPGERPLLAYDDMCDCCKTRLEAMDARKQAIKRRGAAKRAVEAVGKRLNAEKGHDEEECDPEEVCPKCGEKGVAVGAYCHMVEE